MNKILSIDYSDFFFNGNWLSSFSAEIGSNAGVFPITPAPPMEHKTEENALGRDGEIVYNSYYKPRNFTLPILLNDLSRLRDISAWLNTKVGSPFYWKNDDVFLTCRISTLGDIQRSSLQYGLTEIRFIAHDPYFYKLNEVNKVYNSFTQPITLINEGNQESFPLIKVVGSGDITVSINGKTFTVKSVSAQAYVDGLYMTCYKSIAEDTLMTGSYPVLSAGSNTIIVTGNCSSIEILCRSRWV